MDFAAVDHEFDISICGIREGFGRRKSPQARLAGFRLVQGGSTLPFRWRLLRDWKRPAQPIGAITSLRSNNCFHVSLGCGTSFSVDSEFKEAFGFLGLEVTQAVMVRHIFPLLSSLSLCATYPLSLASPAMEVG